MMQDYLCVECAVIVDLTEAYRHKSRGHNVEPYLQFGATQPPAKTIDEPLLIEAEPVENVTDYVVGKTVLVHAALYFLGHHYRHWRGWDSLGDMQAFDKLVELGGSV